MNLRSSGVGPDVTQSILAVVVAELHVTGFFASVISRSDIVSLLTLEQQKQVLGCDEEDSQCLAEIGGALGVDRVVAGNVGRVGDRYLISLSLIDTASAVVLERSYLTADKVDALLTIAPQVVRRLLQLEPLETPPAPTEPPLPPAMVSASVWSYPIPSVILFLAAGAEYEHPFDEGTTLDFAVGATMVPFGQTGGYGGVGGYLHIGANWFLGPRPTGWFFALRALTMVNFHPENGLELMLGGRTMIAYRIDLEWGFVLSGGLGLDLLLLTRASTLGEFDVLPAPLVAVNVGWVL